MNRHSNSPARWLLLLCFVCVGCAQIIRPNYSQTLTELRAGEYSLDKQHAYVVFRIGHLGLSTVVGRFNVVDATLDFNPEQLDALRLDGLIDMASVDVNNEDLQKRLRGADWFATEQFPQATFVTREVVPVAGNRFTIIGDITLRGITRQLQLDAQFNGGADNLLTGKYTLGFAATSAINRSDFGMDSFAALVADEVKVEIHAEFQRN